MTSLMSTMVASLRASKKSCRGLPRSPRWLMTQPRAREKTTIPSTFIPEPSPRLGASISTVTAGRRVES